MQPRQCTVREIWKRDISRKVYQPKLIFAQKWWLISTGISSPGHLWNINGVFIEFDATTFIWEWKMSSSGKGAFSFGSGFFLCVQLQGVLLSPKIPSHVIAQLLFMMQHFLIPVIPQEHSMEPTHRFHTKSPISSSQIKAGNTSGKTTLQIPSIFFKTQI